MKIRSKNKGFTLIELLVVIAIIGLLAAIVLVSLNSARKKARDAKRQADMRQLATAEEMYYDANSNAYFAQAADACSTAITGCTGTYPTAITGFMTTVPVDPTNTSPSYYYRARANTAAVCTSGVANSCYCFIATNSESLTTNVAYYASDRGSGTTTAGAVTCP